MSPSPEAPETGSSGDNPRGGLMFDKKARDDRNPISPSLLCALGTKNHSRSGTIQKGLCCDIP